jgi:hypothetical protein
MMYKNSVILFGTVQTAVFWNCSDSVVLFGTVQTAVFWNCSDSVILFGTVQTAVFCSSNIHEKQQNTTLSGQFQHP